MTEKEILVELRKGRKENKRLLNKLVEEKVRLTNKEKFSLQEIQYYSQFLNISMNKLLQEVLFIGEEDYRKIINGQLKNINSEKFNQFKARYIKKKKNIYKYRINWNKRNYFNKEKLELRSKKFSINVLDFSMQILGKSKPCVTRVLKSSDNTKRFYVGKYINCRLPDGYFENNVEVINRIAKCAVRRAIFKFGIRMNKELFDEEVQKSLVYIWCNGNGLNKFGEPIMTKTEFKPKHGKIFYCKIYYNEISEIGNRFFGSEYNENIKYGDFQNQEIPIEEYAFMEEFSEIQQKIAKLLSDKYCPNEVMSILGISEEFYNNQIEIIKAKYINEMNVFK